MPPILYIEDDMAMGTCSPCCSTRYDFLVKDKDMQFIKLLPEKIKSVPYHF